MRLVMLGTGHALVTRCYNACFVLEDDPSCGDGDFGKCDVSQAGALQDEGMQAPCGQESAPVRKSCFLVDAGGGNGILTQLERAHIDWRNISDLFITHTHIDHLLGAVWMLRLVCHHMNEGDYDACMRDSVCAGEGGSGEGCDGAECDYVDYDAATFTVWGNDQVIGTLENLARMLLRPQEVRFLGNRVRLHAVRDGETHLVMGRPTTFFDIRSKGAKQFGFAMGLSGDAFASPHARRMFVCTGDEPFNEANRAYVEGAQWLVHEAFCLASDEARYNPHPINHGTVAEACAAAERLGVRNLVLYHTEDDDLPHRKERYLAEGRRHFSGNLYVPEDLEAFEL